jgi:G:T/U-mismatch repair DNA glycosylase
MDTQTRTRKTAPRDSVLEAAKREHQERSREQVRRGERTQASLFLISSEIVRTFHVHFTSDEF